MPRRKLTVPKVRWDVYVSEDLAAQVELRLMNPLTQRAKFGARGELVEQLLREWVRDGSGGPLTSGSDNATINIVNNVNKDASHE